MDLRDPARVGLVREDRLRRRRGRRIHALRATGLRPAGLAFPTSPASPDAVLLMTAHVLPEFARRRAGPHARAGRGQGPHPARHPRDRGVRRRPLDGDRVHAACRLPARGRVQDRAAAPALPPAAARPENTLSWREDVEVALERLLGSMSPERRARDRCRTRPAGSLSRTGRASAALPVGASWSGGRYSRCTATAIASATHHGTRVGQPARIAGVGEVADLDAHGRHPGPAQQVPGLGVGPAVDAGRCGRRSRAAPGPRTARRSASCRPGCRWRSSTSPRPTPAGCGARRRAARSAGRRQGVGEVRRARPRSRSVSGPRVRNAVTPVALSRPSIRAARS